MQNAEHILENLPCGCIAFDSLGEIVYVNPTICKILGDSADKLLNRNLEDVLTISSRIFYQTHFFPLLKLQGHVNEIFLNLKSVTGDALPVLVNVNSSELYGNHYYIGTFTTILERHNYEQRLIQTQKEQEKLLQQNDALLDLKSKFEASQQELDGKLSLLVQRNGEYLQVGKVLTHDMQELIRKAFFFFEALLEEGRIKQEEADLKKIGIIRKSISRLRSLTNALFDFVDLNSDREAGTLLPVSDLIRQAEAEVRKSMQFEDFRLQISKIPDFYGKAVQIKRVFVELLKNAIQNRDYNRQLIIEISAVEIKNNSYQNDKDKYRYVSHIQLEIQDNGIGFDSRQESDILDLSHKLNKNSQGFGFGLTLCKQIISRHHGIIKVSSKLLVGTKFTIVMPLETKPYFQ